MAVNPIGEEDEALKGRIVSIELKIVRVHLEEAILMDNHPNHIDPDKWRPLIMSFQQFYSLAFKAKVRVSPLGLYLKTLPMQTVFFVGCFS
jgi:hypothetical protein